MLNIIAIIIATVIMNLTPVENLYPMTAVVTTVDYETDIVTMRDFNGNLWQFEGCEDWLENDVVACIMNNKGTPIIFDDEIVDLHYEGWLEGWLEN